MSPELIRKAKQRDQAAQRIAELLEHTQLNAATKLYLDTINRALTTNPEPLTNWEYLDRIGEDGTPICPHCHDQNVLTLNSDYSGKPGVWNAQLECCACHSTWTEEYTLTGYRDLKEPQ